MSPHRHPSTLIALACAAPLTGLAAAEDFWHGPGHAGLFWGMPTAWDLLRVPNPVDNALLTAGIGLDGDYGISELRIDGSASSVPITTVLNGYTLSVRNGGEWQRGGFANGDFQSAGTVELDGTMTLLGSDEHFAELDVHLNNAGMIEHTGTGDLTIDRYNNAGTHMFTGNGSITNLDLNTGRVNNTGLIAKTGGTEQSTIEPELNNEGEIEAASGTLLIAAPLDIEGTRLTGGTWRTRADSTLKLNAASNLATNEAEIILHGTANGMFVNDTDVQDSMTGNAGTLTVYGTRAFSSGTGLANTGLFLAGGNANLTVDLANSGTLRIATPPGQATILGDLTLESSGTLWIKVGGTLPGDQHDRFDVVETPAPSGGTVSVDGTLRVQNISGYNASLQPHGTSFDILTAPTITGTFSSLIYTNGLNSRFNVEYLVDDDPGTTDTVRLVVVQIPCNAVDFALPNGVLDLNDIMAFIDAFIAQHPSADLNGDGIHDLSDVVMFPPIFIAGCQ
jgi:hypothetical protein